MHLPLVSIIIPVFNRADLLAETLKSALGQSYERIEVVAIDDGSTDESPALLRHFASNDSRMKIVSQSNQGVGIARQRGFEESSGELIQFLDSDDLLAHNKIEVQLSALLSTSHAVAYSPTFHFRGSWQDETPARQTGTQIGDLLLSMLERRCWETVSPLYRRSVCVEAGPWQPLVSEEDWEFDVRIAALVRSALFVPETASFYRIRASQETTDSDFKFRSRARAHLLIARHAQDAGVTGAAPEFRAFARYTFLLARQCAARELLSEAEALIAMASGIDPRRDIRVYSALSRTFGRARIARLAAWTDRFRR